MVELPMLGGNSLRGLGQLQYGERLKIINLFVVGWEQSIFIETGTYCGDMVNSVMHLFSRVISIEYGATLATNAQRRFSDKSHVEIVQGDSALELPKILDSLWQDDRLKNILFFLDGHFSGGDTAHANLDTPIVAELKAISAANSKWGIDPMVILIDDAVDFGRAKDYPTEMELCLLHQELFPGFTIDNYRGIYRIYDSSRRKPTTSVVR